MNKELIRYENSSRLIAGIDECGRGSLAGPVISACVILKPGFSHHLIKDSKKLSEKNRILLGKIIEDNSIYIQIGQIEAPRIDEINILNATMEAMKQCVFGGSMDLLLIDGNQWKNKDLNIPYELVIKGDNTYQEIAAASIIAKNYRDKLMKELDSEFPMYGWGSNMGYGTKLHFDSIEKHGICKHHRKSFLTKYI